MTPETRIKRAICSWLKWKRGFCFTHDSVGIWDPVRKIYRRNSDPFRLKGIPDILGIWKKKFLAIEVKAKGNYPTIEQKAMIQLINEQGGIAFVARSIDDVKEKLEPSEEIQPQENHEKEEHE